MLKRRRRLKIEPQAPVLTVCMGATRLVPCAWVDSFGCVASSGGRTCQHQIDHEHQPHDADETDHHRCDVVCGRYLLLFLWTDLPVPIDVNLIHRDGGVCGGVCGV